MLGVISPRPVLALLTFWWPLLLSVKALKAPGQNVQFLLTYWLFYACISGTQHLLAGLAFPLSSAINLILDFLHVWMFYSHGCLVALHHYIPSITGHTSAAAIVNALDHKVVDPLVSILVVRNRLLQRVLASRSSNVPPLDDFLLFNQSLCEHHALLPTRLSFLQFSLHYFCYVDLESELQARYAKSRGVLARFAPSLSSSVGGAASSKASSRVSSQTMQSRNVSVSSSRNGSLAWRSAPQTRPSSGRASRDVSSHSQRLHSQGLSQEMGPNSSLEERTYLLKPTRVSLSPAAHFDRAAERRHASMTTWPQSPNGSGKIHVRKRAKPRVSSSTAAELPYPLQ
ncbi:hypothetical protein METBIDRAFT_12053 [Metschnikowia bicuspidata var. bicuspidata NRRL YB-4993]|uniref:DUF1753-domain-containing protein n=1 Tax=Metschnikowia bicuspidata var. bicuspidata NRRL YB-4993 TaxID=869754 RepID=A0A1A0HC50_9ASCO|nr:hypothetical protein METBIDRAFT_12053 [Metschnikowia bicuspidata var. bicuspidata NRRL YB-4993]OBA21560.1 hypothetical protein METBIDRAFT_12053 [Metschnikowia bicuspidata var. bicuspidata NRRL YB-4993]